MNIRIPLIFSVLMAGFALQAQSRVAHVDITRLYQNLPEVQAVKDSLDQEQKSLEKQGEAMINEYTVARENYTKRRPNMSEADRKAKEDELAAMEQNLMAFRDNGQSRLEEHSKRMLNPVKTKVENTLAIIAKEKGYDYILDSTEDTVRYANPENDITDLVLERLGVKKK